METQTPLTKTESDLIDEVTKLRLENKDLKLRLSQVMNEVNKLRIEEHVSFDTLQSVIDKLIDKIAG